MDVIEPSTLDLMIERSDLDAYKFERDKWQTDRSRSINRGVTHSK